MLSYINGPLKCDGPLNCWLIFTAFALPLYHKHTHRHTQKHILYSQFARCVRTNDKLDFPCYSFQLDFVHTNTFSRWWHTASLFATILICQFMRALKFGRSVEKTKSSAFQLSSRLLVDGRAEVKNPGKLCMSISDTTSARASTLITISIEFYVLKHILWFYSRRRSCFHFIYCQLPALGLPSFHYGRLRKEINMAFSFY